MWLFLDDPPKESVSTLYAGGKTAAVMDIHTVSQEIVPSGFVWAMVRRLHRERNVSRPERAWYLGYVRQLRAFGR